MAVIKCSNCENEILDTEIVCPYCDCPVSESVKKVKNDELKDISAEAFGDAKPADEVKADEIPVATSFDFAKEKAAILKDLGIKVPGEEEKEKEEDDDSKAAAVILPEDAKAPGAPKDEDVEKTVIDVPMEKTVKISRDAQEVKPTPKPAAHVEPAAKRSPESARVAPRKPGDPSRPPVRKPAPQRPPVKKAKKKKKSSGKYLILAITIIGIAVVIYLIWGIAGSISTNINKTKKTNKIVKVVDSTAQSDADAGFELHSVTLTITSDDVMVDYDSPQDTPWYEHKDKIKHVTFGKEVTRIGAHAFEGFDTITDINISDSVEYIGESAFCNCTELEKITNMSKNLEEIDDYAFTGCKKLVKIPGYTEESDFEPALERIGVEAFKSCKALPAFKVATYTQIDTDAFYGHGDDFAIVCKRSSEAYEYASEKGIPTKTDFEEDIDNEVTEYIPATTPAATPSTETKKDTSKKDDTKKDITRNEIPEESEKPADNSEADTGSTNTESNGNTDAAANPSAPSTTPSTGPSTTPSTGNTTPSAPVTSTQPSAPAAGNDDGGLPPAGSTSTGIIAPGQALPTPGSNPTGGNSYGVDPSIYDMPDVG